MGGLEKLRKLECLKHSTCSSSSLKESKTGRHRPEKKRSHKAEAKTNQGHPDNSVFLERKEKLAKRKQERLRKEKEEKERQEREKKEEKEKRDREKEESDKFEKEKKERLEKLKRKREKRRDRRKVKRML